jgi:F-type H+-transporting ATPase subunit b
MYYRFVNCLVIAIAVIGVSPLWGGDDPPAEVSTPAASAAEDPPEAGVAELAPTVESPSPPVTAEVIDADFAGGEAAAPAGQSHEGESDHGSGDHDAHDAGHGDAHDLSHANASAAMNSPQEFRSDLAIWTFVVFVCLLVILGKFAWGPIMEGLEKRERSIAAMIEEAKQGQENAAEQLKQYEAKLAAAGEEARELVAQARKDAETAKDRILAEAQQAADRQRQRAIEDIQVAKNVALQEMTEKSVDLAVNLAGRIVRQHLKAEDHSQLIREAMDQLPSRN